LTEANSRQLYRRAEQRLALEEGRFEVVPERQEELVASFLAAAREGDLSDLERLLADDVTWWGDGGGKVSAAPQPIEGREKVMRFLGGIFKKFAARVTFSVSELNGTPGLLAWEDGVLVSAIGFEYRDGRIVGVRAVLNPDKLDFVRRQLA
ncbi:nuclear transport factor 2 family protein, partial [Streptomyces sp. NPDC002920]